MKFLLLGASGLMGRYLHAALKTSNDSVLALSHQALDIRNQSLCQKILDKERPDVVINAAAFCSFDGCEREPELSRQVNLEAPRFLSQECAKRAIRLVLFSSDYIFDGKLNKPYLEEDRPSPLSIYGQHKAALETELQHIPTNLILRPAWIFGAGGKTFMSLMPDLFCQHEQIEVASGKMGSCLHAADGASTIIKLAARGVHGVWNLVHPGATSWEEFASRCLEKMRRRGYPVKCQKVIPRPFTTLTSSSSAQRPAYSVLDTSKLDSLTELALPPWQTGLQNFLDRWATEKGWQ